MAVNYLNDPKVSNHNHSCFFLLFFFSKELKKLTSQLASTNALTRVLRELF